MSQKNAYICFSSHFNCSWCYIKKHCSWCKTGEIAEHDAPAKLLEDSSSLFAKLVLSKCKKYKQDGEARKLGWGLRLMKMLKYRAFQTIMWIQEYVSIAKASHVIILILLWDEKCLMSSWMTLPSDSAWPLDMQLHCLHTVAGAV